jgi:hypothetical protein
MFDHFNVRVCLHSGLEEAVLLGLRYDTRNVLCASFVFDERANRYDIHVLAAQNRDRAGCSLTFSSSVEVRRALYF